MEEAIEQLSKERDDLRTQLAAAKQHITSLESVNNKYGKEVASWRIKLENANKDIVSAKRDCGEIRLQLFEALRVIGVREMLLSDVVQQFDKEFLLNWELKENLRKQEAENVDLKVNWEKQRKDLERKNAENMDLKVDREKRRNDLERKNAENENLKVVWEKQRKDLERKNAEKENLKKDWEKQKKDLERKNDVILGLNKQVVELRNDLEKQLQNNQNRNVETHHSIYCCITMLIAYYGVGYVVVLLLARNFNSMNMGIVAINCWYFMVIASFSIGFGDIYPLDALAKVSTCFLVIFGVQLVNCFCAIQAKLWTRIKLKFLRECDEPKNTRVIHGLATVAVCASVAIGVGGIIAFEKHSTGDAFYLAFIALSTEGFGDLSFMSVAGRVFASLWLMIFQPLYASATKFLIDSLWQKLACC